MAFSFACDKAGFATEQVDTTARVSLIPDGDGFLIDRIALTLDAKVLGIDAGQFQQIAESAKRGCPLSKALGSVGLITLTATLKT